MHVIRRAACVFHRKQYIALLADDSCRPHDKTAV
jgi:hypothetical protein